MTRAEYNQCVDVHADAVYRFIVKNLRHEDAARDVVQDAFEKVWRHVGDVHFDQAKSYLFSVAYRTMIDHLRKARYQEDIDTMPLERHEYTNDTAVDLPEILEEALGKLPELQRSVIMLRDYEGYSYKEIGEITQLTESQVKVYIFRARKALKKFIGKLEVVI